MIRKNGVAKGPDMEILFMSGYSRSTMERQAPLDPKVHSLEKPFAPDALVRKVREVLGGVPPHPASPPPSASRKRPSAT